MGTIATPSPRHLGARVECWLRRRWRRAGAHGACPLRRWALLTVCAMEVLVTPYSAVLPSPRQVDPVRANVAWLPVRVIELLRGERRSSEDLNLPISEMLRQFNLGRIGAASLRYLGCTFHGSGRGFCVRHRAPYHSACSEIVGDGILPKRAPGAWHRASGIIGALPVMARGITPQTRRRHAAVAPQSMPQ